MPVEDERYDNDSYDPEQARKYNKQSNLYDPEGKSYTTGSAYPPQVDTYNQSASSEAERDKPIFNDMQQQLAATQRQASTNPKHGGDPADDKRLSQQYEGPVSASTGAISL
ncbi:hypothetical protein KDH_60710 [Dictyobacter sp. S3.2.2.5]|uniref:Uncharacterized protein n=1 Tax=Dictyobacter halimunensis TaxID=3026934 RepID=A0ABQ6G3N1_9CHLR|nr:hypothetical protein KDH_60710 [Dictyobacter sp. S3.2.2.5]